MEIIFTARARRHLREQKAYIARKSYQSRADAYIARLIDYCERLSTFPERGSKHDDILLGLRVIGFEKSANVAFVVTEDAVLIEGFFFGGQSVEQGLKRPR